MKIRLLFALTATVLAIACGTGDESNDVGSGISALLPSESDMQGWRIADGPITYDSVSLYEYLNGGAERYLAHGFSELVHVRYQLGADPAACVTLDVYDMGSGLGAFGIYFFRFADEPTRSRTSSIAGVALGTTREQAIVELIPEFYWDEERWHLVNYIRTLNQP